MSDSTTMPPEPKPAEATVRTSFAEPKPAAAADKKPTPLFQKPGFVLVAGVAFVALVMLGTHFFLNSRGTESTDDAFIDGHVISVAPKVSGRVASVAVKDNQRVKKGNLLFTIDPEDYQVILEQKEAALAQAQARQRSEEAAFKEAQAHVETVKIFGASALATMKSTQATTTKNQEDYNRNESLVKRGVISEQDFQHSSSDLDSSKADLESKEKQAQAAYAYVKEAELDSNSKGTQVTAAEADVKAAQAQVRQAQLQVSYAKVYAPADGLVTRKAVEAGSYLQAGQSTMALVPAEVWVTANFKETQLTEMKPGQPAKIAVDAYPAHDFKGHVDSIQAGSGAAFSLLPPENATGNFVKVVQRVPVKILLDEAPRANEVLGPGMSAVPTVVVKEIHGRWIILLLVGVVAAIVALIIGRKLISAGRQP
jgi:membrane fusion protein (multidrug efflux system)